MNQKLSDQDQTRLALAALIACVANSLSSSGVIAPRDFVEHLEKASRTIAGTGGDTSAALQALAWTKELAVK